MDNEKLMPSLDAKNHVSADTGEVLEAKYLVGEPRQYRFDARKGVVNINGETPVTKAGGEFKFKPIAARIFRSNLFERGRQVWCELFFLNAANQLCVIMFHGYSVENIERLQSELFYEDLRLDEVILTMKPESKTSKASGGAYYIAEFDFVAAKRDLHDAQTLAVEGLRIYRADTTKEDEDILVNLNYYELPKLEAPDTNLEDIAALPSAASDEPEEYEDRVAREASSRRSEK